MWCRRRSNHEAIEGEESWSDFSELKIRHRKVIVKVKISRKVQYRRFQNLAIPKYRPNIAKISRYYRIRYIGAIFWSDIFLRSDTRYIAEINYIVWEWWMWIMMRASDSLNSLWYTFLLKSCSYVARTARGHGFLGGVCSKIEECESVNWAKLTHDELQRMAGSGS